MFSMKSTSGDSNGVLKNKTKYSRVDQENFVEDSLSEILKGYGLLKQTISLQIF